LVEAQPPILDTRTQRRHVTTVWRRTAYGQAGNLSSPEQRAGPGSMTLSATVKEAVADAQVEASQEEGAEAGPGAS
jgi:hypothetical protein